MLITYKLNKFRKRREKMFKALLSKLSAKSNPPTVIQETSVAVPQKVFLFEPNAEELKSVIDSSYPEGGAPGYVYFVQEHLNGSFKIGKTKNIDQRMNLFNVKLPFEHQLVFLIKSGNHHQTEAAFHKHFSEKRLEGEWFSLTKEDLVWLKAKAYTAEITQTIFPVAMKKTNQLDEASILPLTEKQLVYAKSLIDKLHSEYELMVDYTNLTKKDLDRLSVYFRYKNIGALNNLVKTGVLRKVK